MQRVLLSLVLFLAGGLSAREPHFFNPLKKTEYVSMYNFAIDADWSIFNTISPIHTLQFWLSDDANQDIRDKKNSVKRQSAKQLYSIEKIAKNGKDGDIIHVDSVLPEIVADLLEKTDKRFILTILSDDTFPHEYENAEKILKLLEEGTIIHLFANNVDLAHSPENVTLIPIGYNYTRPFFTPKKVGKIFPRTPHEHDRALRNFLTTLKPTTERIPRVYCDFALSNTSSTRVDAFGEDRAMIAAQLEGSGVCDFLEKRVPKEKLLEEKGKRAFDISPPGQGMDCYRTWESLILGCIVIVKTSFLDPLYEGLPVVIVDDWSEVTEDNLKRWLEEYGDVFHNDAMREKLTHEYWMQKIKKVQSDYRSQNK